MKTKKGKDVMIPLSEDATIPKMRWQFLNIVVLFIFLLLFNVGCGTIDSRIALPISNEGCKPFGKPVYMATKEDFEIINDSLYRIILPLTLVGLPISLASDTIFLLPDLIFGYGFGWRSCNYLDMPKSKEDNNTSLYEEP